MILSYPTGFRILIEVLGVLHGPKEACVRTLQNGHLLAIAPGGVREALFSDEMYTILWCDRKGFAQVAIDAKVVSMPRHGREVKKAKLLVLSFRESCFDYHIFDVRFLTVMSMVCLL